MSDYVEHLIEHCRTAVLRFLASAPEYTANDSMLHGAVTSIGVAVTRAQLRTALAWLRDQDLVKLDEAQGLMIARITEAGADVAAGRTTVPGVKRPSPR